MTDTVEPTTTTTTPAQQKMNGLQRDYANLCFKLGDCTHKADHYTGVKERTLIELRNIEVTLEKLNKELEQEKATATTTSETSSEVH